MFLLLPIVLSLVGKSQASQELNWDFLSALSSAEGAIDCEVCTIIVKNAEQSHSSQYKCITYADEEADGAEDMVYDLPGWLLAKHASYFESKPTSYLRIHGGQISRASADKSATNRMQSRSSSNFTEDDSIIASKNSIVEFSDNPFRPSSNRRKLAPSRGISSVLLVRVTATDGSVSLNADTISDRVFGSSGTVRSTFSDCSFGKLQLEPATGPSVVDGVVELSVDMNFQGQTIKSLENTLSTALTSKIGSVHHLDHVAFCVPAGTSLSGNQNLLAYAYVGNQRSVFNNENCGYLSTIVHEFGHNMGLGHSGEGRELYGDQSGIMGYGYSRVSYPVMCFNAAKNWQLGWYSDKSVTVSVADNAWRGRLYGYSDYQASEGNVLIQVGDVFLQYNKIANINKDTMEKRNKIAITRSPIAANAKSEALAGIDMSNTVHAIDNFMNGEALFIEVCDMVQVANGLTYFDLSIRLTSQAIPHPSTSLPSKRPTTPPVNPTAEPTPAPVVFPTNRPTPLPTMRPTMISNAPSVIMSAIPTTMASDNPTRFSSTSDLACDDHKLAKFPVDESTGYYQSCIWLAARPEWQEKLCVESHPAYTICEETCGSCSDGCEDSNETFGHHGIERPCSWLSIRWFVQEIVCVSGHRAMDVCKETCDVCDIADKTR